MWDFKIGQALGLMLKTLPFILFRLAVYFGVALAYVLMTGAGASVGWGIGGLGDEGFRAASTFWGGAIGFGIVGAVMYVLREYLLYVVKAGHIAVLVELLDGQTLPEGRGQIDHAQTVVRERFGQASLLFGIDQLIKGCCAPSPASCAGSSACCRYPARGSSFAFSRHSSRSPSGSSTR
ncbi:MAG: hypothetical protein ACQEXG_13950 [Pseudomonadota bacterium]